MAGTRERMNIGLRGLRAREIEVLAVRAEAQMRQRERLAWNDLRFPISADLFHPEAVLIAIVLDIGDGPAVGGNGAMRGLTAFRDLGDRASSSPGAGPPCPSRIQLDPNTIAKRATSRTRPGLS